MARKDARTVSPSLSGDARDKLAAALAALGHAKLRDSAEYDRAQVYYPACLDWFQRLSEEHQRLCRTLADIIGSCHRAVAEDLAASLPPAPRNPL